MVNPHEGREHPVTAHVEYRGERTAFGEPMLRLVVGEEWIGMSPSTALRFSNDLQEAAAHVLGLGGPPGG